MNISSKKIGLTNNAFNPYYHIIAKPVLCQVAISSCDFTVKRLKQAAKDGNFSLSYRPVLSQLC